MPRLMLSSPPRAFSAGPVAVRASRSSLRGTVADAFGGELPPAAPGTLAACCNSSRDCLMHTPLTPACSPEPRVPSFLPGLFVRFVWFVACLPRFLPGLFLLPCPQTCPQSDPRALVCAVLVKKQPAGLLPRAIRAIQQSRIAPSLRSGYGVTKAGTAYFLVRSS
jgi:hypothetical protein